MTHYDAIVVGCGPAGATAALELGRAGVQTLLVERERLPRAKPCGGGLTAKTVSALALDLSTVVERTVTAIDLSWRLARPARLHSPDPLVCMVQRSRFDAFLVERALATGNVALADGCAVRGIELRADGGFDVRCVGDTHRADVVLGADGANGVVARALGLLRARRLLPAVEAEVEVDDATLEHWHARMGIDMGSMRGAYGWVFPKRDHLNVGVGCFAPQGSNARHLNRYAAAHLAASVRGRVRRRVGSVLPLRPRGAPIAQGRALLLGDAAGLVDGFSGEGIYWAVRSAQIAAAVVARGAADAYAPAIDAELMPELIEARRWAALYLWWPRGCYSVPKRWPPAWRAVCGVLRGDSTFTAIGRRFGPLASLPIFRPA